MRRSRTVRLSMFATDTGHRRSQDFYCRGALRRSVILRLGRVKEGKEGKVWGGAKPPPLKTFEFFSSSTFYA